MSEIITKEQLLLLKKEDLTAKYLEVTGSEANAALTKEQLADSILSFESAPALTGSAPVPPAPTSGAIANVEKPVNSSKLGYIHLVKTNGDGQITDEMTLPQRAWNNLSANHKKGWKVKTPVDLK